jgi:hypothetical protein
MRWLVFLPAAILALYSTTVEAQEQPTGVLVTVYDNWTQWNQYNNAPPLPPTTRIAGMVTQQQVLNNFDAQPLFGLRDDFVVRYEGHLTAPSTGAVQFMAQADDGTKLFINDELATDDWYDKGGGGSISAPVDFTEGVSQPFTLWFYENGGGAWVQLWWLIDGAWEIVPASAFTQLPVSTTSTTSTTTTLPTTTTSQTTTTVQVVPTTQPVEPSTTTTPMPTSTETTSVQTTTSVETSTTYQPSESTAMPSSTAPTAIIDSTVISSTSTTLPATNTSTVVVRPTVTPNLTTTTQETPTTIAPVATTTTIQVQVPQEGSNAAEAVTTALVGGVSNDEAKTIVLDENAVAVLDKTEAEAVFAALDVDALNETELAVLVATVQQASDDVREAFEEQINVFSGAVDSYVPLGSNVPVSTRRVVIAVSAALSAVPTPTRKSR